MVHWKQLYRVLTCKFVSVACGKPKFQIHLGKVYKTRAVLLKGEFRAEFFFKKLHSSYRALKCQKNPISFHLNYFFHSEVIEVLRYISLSCICVIVIVALTNLCRKLHVES